MQTFKNLLTLPYRFRVSENLWRLSPIWRNNHGLTFMRCITTEGQAGGDSEKGEPLEGGGGEENKAEADEPVLAPVQVVAKIRGYEKDRAKEVPVEVSMRYLKSEAYKETYGDNLVWVLYRRNFKGQFAPPKTRKTCIRQDMLTTGNPCPICRDEFLVLDYRNTDLLKQFISPFNGETLGYSKTGVCQVKHTKLLVEIRKAKDAGTISFDVPFRKYDYAEYEQLYDSYNST